MPHSPPMSAPEASHDAAHGLNDWEPVVAYVRGLLENTETPSCWSRTKIHVLDSHTLLSQTFVQYLGRIRDERGVPIVAAKLEAIDGSQRTFASPWCEADRPLEQVCLEALAQIGGPAAQRAIDEHVARRPAARAFAAGLTVPEEARPCVASEPMGFPAVLRGVRSIHDVVGAGGCAKEVPPERAAAFVEALRALPWYGPVEHFSGDGHTRTFKAKHKLYDHIHDRADRYSDCGIFKSDPKLEYPLGRRRWANSHTFLSFRIPDGALYGHEYTYSVEENTITTHFHHHVAMEEATVNPDGRTVTVERTPISTGVEVRGNTFSRRCSSAVRGVWDNPGKAGTNYYVRRANVLTSPKRLIYFRPLHEPVVNQLGIWHVAEEEQPERFFDEAGLCRDIEGVVEELLIPLHEPKVLCWSLERYEPRGSGDRFAQRLPEAMRVDLTPVPPVAALDRWMGAYFEHSRCGNAGIERGDSTGYDCGHDLNSDGVIDEADRDLLARHAGAVYRMNIGDYGYFGFNWLSTGNRPRNALHGQAPVRYVCAYDYGGGYEPETGVVRLLEPMTPGRKVYVEYFHDAPAAEGRDNIRAYLHGGVG